MTKIFTALNVPITKVPLPEASNRAAASTTEYTPKSGDIKSFNEVYKSMWDYEDHELNPQATEDENTPIYTTEGGCIGTSKPFIEKTAITKINENSFMQESLTGEYVKVFTYQEDTNTLLMEEYNSTEDYKNSKLAASGVWKTTETPGALKNTKNGNLVSMSAVAYD